jgi:large subunit ribosomal protein L22
MQAIAKARYVRISPRKVDQILMLIRGKSVARSLATLRLVTKSARPLVEKVLISAMANAGKQANADAWHVEQAWVGYGPTMKRMRAHAMGRGATIRHHSAHMTIVLSDERAKKKSGAN